jgi:hypothetical protein
MSQWDNPKTHIRREALLATLGVPAIIAGPPQREIINSAFSAGCKRGEFIEVESDASFWIATIDPTAPGATVLRMIARGIPGSGGAVLPDLLVVVGESPKYTLSASQRTAIFGVGEGVDLAVSLGGTVVLVEPGTYDHSALGAQTVPSQVEIIGLCDDPRRVQIIGQIDMDGSFCALENVGVELPAGDNTSAYTVRVTSAAQVNARVTNCRILSTQLGTGAGAPDPALLIDNSNVLTTVLVERSYFTKKNNDDLARAISLTQPLTLTLRDVQVDAELASQSPGVHTGIAFGTDNGNESLCNVELDRCTFSGRVLLDGGSFTARSLLVRNELDPNAAQPIRINASNTPARCRLSFLGGDSALRHANTQSCIEANMTTLGNAVVFWNQLNVLGPSAQLGAYVRFSQNATAFDEQWTELGSGVVQTLLGLPVQLDMAADVVVTVAGGATDVPNPERAPAGRMLQVKNLSAGVVTLNAPPTTFLDAALTTYNVPAGGSVTLRADPANSRWVFVGQSGAPTTVPVNLKYIVAPAWMGMVGTYLSITGPGGALAAAYADGLATNQPAVVFVFPNGPTPYIEDFTIATGTPLRAGVSIVGMTGNVFPKSLPQSFTVAQLVNGPIQMDPAFPGSLYLENMRLVADPSSSVMQYGVGEWNVRCSQVMFECLDGSLAAISAGATSSGYLELDNKSQVTNSPGAGGVIRLDNSAVQLRMYGQSAVAHSAALPGQHGIYLGTAVVVQNIIEECSIGAGIRMGSNLQTRNVVVVSVNDTSTIDVSTNLLTARGYLKLSSSGVVAQCISGSAGGAVNVEDGTLSINAPVVAAVAVSITGPQGRCRFIQRITANAATVYFVSAGVDTVWVDAQVAGAEVVLAAASLLPDGYEVEVLNAPSTATYTAGTTFGFDLYPAAAGVINNAPTVVVPHEGSYVLRVDRAENRYRWAP